MAYTTIKKPSDYFNTKLYTGNGTSQSITGVGFQPDWIWIKNRDTVDSHQLIDSVRGSDKAIFSNLTNAEGTDSQIVSSIDSDGFSVGNRTYSNGSGNSLVSWNWLASNTTASNTVGDINSTVSVNTTSGFSIVSYTGTGANATVGHGLGIAPKFIIVKSRSSGNSWAVQTPTGAGFEMNLNNEEGQTATSVYWNSTDPTSSVFSVGTNAATNLSGDDYIAYVFAPIKGFSKMGTYTGNGNIDGTFVYTGFKPAFLLVKYTSPQKWWIIDNKRDAFNSDPNSTAVIPDAAQAEENGTAFNTDLLSNGFKIRSTWSGINTSGGTYVYMAFAKEPLVGDNPCTAR